VKIKLHAPDRGGGGASIAGGRRRVVLAAGNGLVPPRPKGPPRVRYCRSGEPAGNLLRSPNLGGLIVIDFVTGSRSRFSRTTFALFTSRRFQFDASQDRILLQARFGVLGGIVQGA